jgi:hypothetical protein
MSTSVEEIEANIAVLAEKEARLDRRIRATQAVAEGNLAALRDLLDDANGAFLEYLKFRSWGDPIHHVPTFTAEYLLGRR